MMLSSNGSVCAVIFATRRSGEEFTEVLVCVCVSVCVILLLCVLKC
jgi:hypothetical protein